MLRFFGVPLFKLVPAGVALVLGVIAAVAILRSGSMHNADSGPSASAPIAPAAQPATVAQIPVDRAAERLAMAPKRRDIVVGDGDTLLDLLMRVGVDRTNATAAIAALRRVYDPRSLKVGQRVHVEFGPVAQNSGERPFQTVALSPEPGRRVISSRTGDNFTASANRLPEIHDFAHYAGTIKSSLFESAVAQGVPPQVLAEMIHAFSYDVDFQRDLQPGDAFEVMYQRSIDSQGDVVRAGDIVFAELVLSGKHLPIYRFTDASGVPDYYNAKGESVRKALLRTPVDGARITSKFGMRVNPILGFSMMHKGVDFGVPTGTPVMAAGSGVIEKAGENGAYGLYIRIRHDKVHSTAYAHLSGLARGTRVGAKVMQGAVIGYVGESGRATGPHLHYEVLVNNQQVNPMSVKFKAGSVLAGRDLQRFKSQVAEVETRLAGTPLSTQVALVHRGE